MTGYASLSTTVYELGLEAARAKLRYHGWVRDGSEWMSPPERDSYLQSDSTRGRIPDPSHGPTGAIDISSGYGVMVDVWSEWYEEWVTAAEELFKPWSEGRLPNPAYFAGLAQQTFESAHMLSLTGESVSGHRVPTNPGLVAVANTSQALLQMQGDTISAFREQYVNGFELILPSLCGATATLCEVLTTEGVIFHEAQLSVAKIAEGGLEAMKKAGINEAKEDVDDALSVAGAGMAVFGAITKVGFGTFLGALTGISSLVETVKGLQFKGTLPQEVLDSISDGLDDLSAQIRTEESAAADKASTLSSDLEAYPNSYLLNHPRLLESNDEGGYAGAGAEVLAIDQSRLLEIADIYLPEISTQFEGAYEGVNDAFTGYTEWDREGSIGRTPTGAKPEWNMAMYDLYGIIRQVPDIIAEVRDHLRIAAKYHGDTDDAVAQELADHTASL